MNLLEREALKEALNIRKLVTPEELNNLVPEIVDYSNVTKCVYGLLTGSCTSERAKGLIRECATASAPNAGSFEVMAENIEIGGINGPLDKVTAVSRNTFLIYRLTALEVAIAQSPELCHALVSVIKGERDELV